ncbi:alpha/beta hydrolase family protein [Litoribrevibacter euphylliae]|uniref:Alpha/beta hydrolase family protein n=1 Tax=Litoribrevibacter euphylliae TaxID=1834034 RepID=A0ABV7HQ80_9GAMM
MEIRSRVRPILFWLLLGNVSLSVSQEFSLERPDASTLNYYLFQQQVPLSEKVLLLILQGSDCNSVFNNDAIKRDYSKVWPQADLLFIEKYGIDRELSYRSDSERNDCPKEYIQKDSPHQRVVDIKNVLKVVREQHDYTKLIVLGGSEGAVIANLLAAESEYIDATISFNGGGRWFIDDVIHNILSTQKTPELASADIEGFKGFANHILSSQPFELEVSGHGFDWWQQMLSVDQLGTLQKVKSPVLILQGGSDVSVSTNKVNDMMSVLAKSGKHNIEYKFYDGLNHQLKNSAGQSEIKAVTADIHLWLESVLNRSN